MMHKQAAQGHDGFQLILLEGGEDIFLIAAYAQNEI